MTSPEFDEAVRHARVFAAIGELMGGKSCFGEFGARHMGAYRGDLHRSWRRRTSKAA